MAQAVRGIIKFLRMKLSLAFTLDRIYILLYAYASDYGKKT